MTEEGCYEETEEELVALGYRMRFVSSRRWGRRGMEGVEEKQRWEG